MQVFHMANPSLEERSYGTLEQAGSAYDGPNSSTIVANSVSLLRDLQRLDNLLAIARNVLTAGEKVQNLAAQVGFDREVCSMINLCIKITARGYDGENTSSVEEDRWQGVINGFKKLLITSLQFLSNLVTLNERLKLLLWVELFDSSLDHDGNSKIDSNALIPEFTGFSTREWIDEATGGDPQYLQHRALPGPSPLPPLTSDHDGAGNVVATEPTKPYAAYFSFVEDVKEKVARELVERAAAAGSSQPAPTPRALFAELSNRWKEMSPAERMPWTERYDAEMREYEAKMQAWNAAAASADEKKSKLKLEDDFDLDQFKAHVDNHFDHQKHETQPEPALPVPEVPPAPPVSQPETVLSAAQKPKVFNPLAGVKTWKQLDRALALHFPESGPPIKGLKPLPARPQPDIFAPLPLGDTDFRMTETAEDGLRKLQEGKQQLLKRLESMPADRQQHSKSTTEPEALILDAREQEIVENIAAEYQERLDNAKTQQERNAIINERLAALTLEREKYEAALGRMEPDYVSEGDEDEEYDEDEEDDSEEDGSSDGDYAIPGEDGRGLLTDVPLILGPNEIEVLPMIIMSGIVVPESESQEITARDSVTTDTKPAMNMYTIRCHLLLAQENGRNLLRELLIFVAAWDLREEELYFKFMVKIMEAILMNGLMPFAYGAFKESKDIISPAQAVIMKLLTKIFHSRQGFITQAKQAEFSQSFASKKDEDQANSPGSPAPAMRYDIQIVHCLFTEFRQQIIPQICSLMFLQGQIRRGRAALEDFPLNLWDMERMYEGVYQYLEFFAILTDHDQWKQLMADWEVASELVTLLRELELAIPKQKTVTPNQHQHKLQPLRQVSSSVHQEINPDMPLDVDFPANTPTAEEDELETPPLPKAPVSIEMPYDPNGPSAPVPVSAHSLSQPPPPPPPPTGVGNSKSIPPLPNNATSSSAQTPYSSPPIHDEPADFEWRNLKKLCVLVLSSLVWKNPRLQDQVRECGGITAILSCCNADEHNPFIREHAIMCLRFLVEGNAENSKLVRSIARLNAASTSDAANPAAGSPGHDVDQAERNGGDAMNADDIRAPEFKSDAAAIRAAEVEHREQAKADLIARLDRVRQRVDLSGDHDHAQNPEDQLDDSSLDADEDEDGIRDDEDEEEDEDGDRESEQEWFNESTYHDADFPAASLHVPMEVLDSHGYETFMDQHGQVGLRRKDASMASALHEALGERGGYSDIGLSETAGGVGGDSVAMGGKKTGLLEAIGGLPEWIKNMPPRV